MPLHAYDDHRNRELQMPFPLGVSYQQIKSSLADSPSFYPNTKTVAEFRPHSMGLHFHELSGKAYSAIRDRGPSLADKSSLEVVAHELTHWSDQVSTVWGQEYIVRLFDAYEASFSGPEQNYFKVIDQYDEDRRILFPRY